MDKNYNKKYMIKGKNNFETHLYTVCSRVVFKEAYGTPNVKNTVLSNNISTPEPISTVTDAFRVLLNILKTNKYREISRLNEEYYLARDIFKLTDLHIYEDGTPMRWENLRTV